MSPETIIDQEKKLSGLSLEVISEPDLNSTVNSLFANYDPHGNLVRGLLFAGDRLSVCDEAIALKKGTKVIGLATIAPKGERTGEPTIVGLYIQPQERRKGFGTLVLERTIKRGEERGFGRLRIDVMSGWVMKIIDKLPEELRRKLDIKLYGNVMDQLS